MKYRNKQTGEIVEVTWREDIWWKELKCSTCKNFKNCVYIERKTLKETGDSPACSMYAISEVINEQMP